MNDYTMIFKRSGSRVKSLRESIGMTQKELAEKVGVDRTTITRYEEGQISSAKASTLASLANALGVNLLTLLGHDIDEHDELTDFVSGNKWSSGETAQLINFGKFLISQRGDE
jgi:transcriptional regulator with XRE-family HTH domain